MAGDIDAESAKLIWQLHRELNGLTRTRTRSGPPPPRAVSTGELQQRKRKPESSRGSEQANGSKRSKRSDTSGSSSERSSPDSHHSKDSESPKDNGVTQKLKRLRKKNDSQEASLQTQPPENSDPKGKVSSRSRHEDTANVSDSRITSSKQQAALRPQATALEESLTQFKGFAIQAANLTREKLVNSVNLSLRWQRVKVFFAGKSWGATIPLESLKTRAALAMALNQAFSSDGIACADGQQLHVTFLDAQGNSYAFGPRTEKDSEDEGQWLKASNSAVRVYVR